MKLSHRVAEEPYKQTGVVSETRYIQYLLQCNYKFTVAMGVGVQSEDRCATAMCIFGNAFDPKWTGVGMVGFHARSAAPHVGCGPGVEDHRQ